MAEKRKPAKRQQIRFTVRKLVDPDSGELIKALVPAYSVDRRAMNERKYSVGTELKADVRRSRNSQFYRLAHVLGGWLADNVDGFDGLTQHDAVKRLQELSEIGCEREAFDVPGFGRGYRWVAESLNFDDMDEGRWIELFNGWVEWLRREKWGDLSAEALEEVERLLERER